MIRDELFMEYLTELGQYEEATRVMTQGEREEFFTEYILDYHTEWLDVYSADGQIVGFVIIANSDSVRFCHPSCDYFICQTYIRKPYRDRGLVSRTLKKFFANHHGIYGLFIVDNNTPAKAFWSHITEDYENVVLDKNACNGDVSHLLLLGFRI